MFQKFNGVAIEHISSCVPLRRIENSFFKSLLNEKETKMFEKQSESLKEDGQM